MIGATNSWINLLADSPWLQRVVLGNHLWQWGLFLVYAAAAFAVSQVADLVVTRWLMRAAARTRTAWDDTLLRVLRGPLRLILFVVFLHLAVRVLTTPPLIAGWIQRGTGIVVALLVTYMLVRLVDATFAVTRTRYAKANPGANLQALVLLRKSVKVAILITAALVIADNNEIKINSVLAGLGVTGLAVALASQETLSNLLGSVVILADRPFLVGDHIRIGADEGVVEYIGVRSTRLRTPEGHLISIPNRNITGAAVRNFSRPVPAGLPPVT